MSEGALEMPEKLQVADGEKMSVIDLYHRALGKRGFAGDSSQLRAVERLQQLYEEWSAYKSRRSSTLKRLVVHPPLPRGVYLWGGVGRGKSFLMDSFYLCLPLVRKRRVHFHHFMRDVHREMQELKGREDPLAALAARIAKRYRLICFDEMQVNDIADAMIIGRLLAQTMDLGVVYCMTSNYRPGDLYRDGLKREKFVPTIALLEKRMDVVHVEGGVDYRQRMLVGVRTYHSPLVAGSERALMDAFGKIAEVEEEFHELDVEGRVIPYRHRAGGVAWFDFRIICGWGRSQHDYLDLARRFHTVIVSDVPRMGLALAEEARRFTLLVDVFYDNRVKLIVSADAVPENLVEIEEAAEEASRDSRLRAMVFEFARTASRLVEMQSREYLAESRRAPPGQGAACAAPPV